MNFIDKTGQSFETLRDFKNLFLELVRIGAFKDKCADVKLTPEAYLTAFDCIGAVDNPARIYFGDYIIRLHI